MKKFLVVLMIGALIFAFGCSKEESAVAPASAPHGGGAGEAAMPAPTFVPNAGANWKAAKIKVAAKDGSDEKIVDLEFESSEPTPIEVAGVTVSLKAIQMVPDFVMSGSNIGSRSTELNNPAVQLILTEEGKEPAKQWLFEKMPTVHAFEHEKITITSVGFVEKDGGSSSGTHSEGN